MKSRVVQVQEPAKRPAVSTTVRKKCRKEKGVGGTRISHEIPSANVAPLSEVRKFFARFNDCGWALGYADRRYLQLCIILANARTAQFTSSCTALTGQHISPTYSVDSGRGRVLTGIKYHQQCKK